MQATMVAARRQAGGQFANDGSYESVEKMLKQMAGKFYRRAEAQGLPMEMNDAIGEVNLAYVKASQSWNPEGGARFSTYLYRTLLNEWNSRTRLMVRDRAELGLGSIDDMAAGGEGEEGDGYERHLVEEETIVDRLVRSEEVVERLMKLTPATRLFVSRLLASQVQGAPEQTLAEIAASIGAVGQAASAIRKEIHQVFGIRVTLTPSRTKKSEAV